MHKLIVIILAFVITGCQTDSYRGSGPVTIAPNVQLAFQQYLNQNPNVFVISTDGSYSYAFICPSTGWCGSTPLYMTELKRCEERARKPCKVFAEGKNIVWEGPVSYASLGGKPVSALTVKWGNTGKIFPFKIDDAAGNAKTFSGKIQENSCKGSLDFQAASWRIDCDAGTRAQGTLSKSDAGKWDGFGWSDKSQEVRLFITEDARLGGQTVSTPGQSAQPREAARFEATGPKAKNYTVPSQFEAEANELNRQDAEARDLQMRGQAKQAAAIIEKTLPGWERIFHPDHPLVAVRRLALAGAYVDIGRHGEAEALFKRALPILEKEFGSDHTLVGIGRVSLGMAYAAQGRFADAEPLLRQSSLLDLEKLLGPNHPFIGVFQSIQAHVLMIQGRDAEADAMATRALATMEKAQGLSDLMKVIPLWTQSTHRLNQDRYEEADQLLDRVLTVMEKSLGQNDSRLISVLNAQALSKLNQGHRDEARMIVKRMQAIAKDAFGQSDVGVNPGSMFLMLLADDEFLNKFKNELSQVSGPAARSGVEKDLLKLGEIGGFRGGAWIFIPMISAFETMTRDVPHLHPATRDLTFPIGQLANKSSAERTMAGMAARFAAGSDAVAALVRERQEAESRRRAMDMALVGGMNLSSTGSGTAANETLRRQIAEADKRIVKLDGRLAREFPRYAEIVNPSPVPLTEAQKLLAPHEALVVYLFGHAESFLWVVRHGDARFIRLSATKKEVADYVRDLRASMAEGTPKPFPAAKAHALYRAIFEPAEPYLTGVRDVIVVPHGPLQSLPFSVLLSAPAVEPKNAAGYRALPWLARKYSLATLPAVSSLRALRQYAANGQATRPFVGFGDPAIGEGTGTNRGGNKRGEKVSALFRSGGPVDVDMLRKLPALPETADELREIAKILGVSADQIYLRERFTKPRLRGLPLEKYRVVSFATHAAVANEIVGVIEPSLILTPPPKATADDDGLLRASDVAQLKLNADWVILSACNTAAGDTPGAEGLSGLAKAFFHAGARSLLVSHWPTETESAKRLTTGAFKAQAADPALGRAGALRASMLALMDDPQFAHPLFWAPFVVVGEGGSGSPTSLAPKARPEKIDGAVPNPGGLASTQVAAISRMAPPPTPQSADPAVGVYPAIPAPGMMVRDCDVCPEMMVVPAGEFTIGSPEGEVGRYADEGPQHRVVIAQPFAVGKYEVTFAEWDACVADGGCGGHRPPDYWGRGNRPVFNVSWADAKTYVAWLSSKTGKEYRLPTAAEWEYATRAGTTTPWSCGAQENCLDRAAWHAKNSGRRIHPVGEKMANGFGLYDMHGNVWEWVEDCWSSSYKETPADGSAWTSDGCSQRVVRGGSWNNESRGLRSAIRDKNFTADRLNYIGFRVARTLGPSAPNPPSVQAVAKLTQPPSRPAALGGIPLAVTWEGASDSLAGQMSVSNDGRSGGLTVNLEGGVSCDGKWQHVSGKFDTSEPVTGAWSLACANGRSAVGSYVASKRGQGTGTGRDDRDAAIRFTYGR